MTDFPDANPIRVNGTTGRDMALSRDMTTDDQHLVRYILGSLSDDEAVERWLTSWQTADPPGSTVVDLGGGAPSTPPALARKR